MWVFTRKPLEKGSTDWQIMKHKISAIITQKMPNYLSDFKYTEQGGTCKYDENIASSERPTYNWKTALYFYGRYLIYLLGFYSFIRFLASAQKPCMKCCVSSDICKRD